MLSFLLKQIWIRIDYVLLSFFATLGPILGLQLNVTFSSVLGLQVNTGLQPLTHWEPFAAGTMLSCPEPTKKRVEPTILSIIAIEITHLTRFTLLLLLRILRYMWPRWSDSGFSLSDPILFLKNDIRIRSESCFGWNHTIRIWKLSESVLQCTTYIFVLCLFCLVRQNNCWSYFAFS